MLAMVLSVRVNIIITRKSLLSLELIVRSLTFVLNVERLYMELLLLAKV